MPRGGSRPGSGRPKKGSKKAADVARRKARKLAANQELPLEYMLRVMNDERADIERRDKMATAAAPFLHGKISEVGKKSTAIDAARQAASAGSPFATPPPPGALN